MSDTITLAHLSDVHLSPVRGFALRYLNVKRGLGYLNWQRSRRRVHRRPSLDLVVADLKAQQPDHIAVTGDLINLGLPAEYATALSWLKGLGPPNSVTAVPGNHDIYTVLRGDPGVARWADYMRADAWGARFAEGGRDGFPFVRRLGPVALICLNSAVATPPFIAAGELGQAQIAALARILDRVGQEHVARVVLIHHPPLAGQAPRRRALRDAAQLERVLAEHGAELVLHGHNHSNEHIDFAWKRGRIPVVGIASGSAGRVHKHEPLARYNLLSIAQGEDGVHIECVTRGIDPTGTSVQQIDRKVLGVHAPAASFGAA
ncbi:MAG: metallophosphoesterase family protein [Hyphomicrobium sp.]